VIGESYIKDHASVYGYGLNTTPFLLHEKKAGRLVAFTNAVSPYNFTTKVMRNLISTNSLEDGVRWSECPPLTAVFKRAGYFVSMYDNQRTFAFGATFTFALNSYLYAPRVLKVCYDRTNNNSFEYDGQLVDRYKRDFQEQHSHALTIFHLMGQHIEAVKRYPADRQFNHFSADSIKRKEPWITEEMRRGIAEYDNATLYNDYVMKQIISRYAHRNVVVIYVSDHGEEEYDYRPSAGRKGSDDLKNMLYYQYSVPMMVWFSDAFKEKYPTKVRQIEASAAKPLMTDNICQILFYLGGLTSSPYYSAKHNVLSKDYVCGKRIVNDKYNYDNIVRP
jgi:putative transmembrane sulphatase